MIDLHLRAEYSKNFTLLVGGMENGQENRKRLQSSR